ncbi:MAG: HlyD family efflux transporter periplasmic adaptor subunit [Paludibaculum sp.]
MKSHTTPAVVLITTACIVGAVWTRANLSSSHRWQPDDSSQNQANTEPLRFPGELVSLDFVPVPAALLELDVPLNSRVSKGQLIGEHSPRPNPGLLPIPTPAAISPPPAPPWTPLATSSATFRCAPPPLVPRAEDSRNRMVGAEIAAGEADEVIQRDDMLYREGMESQLKHDEELSLQQSVRQQVDAQSEAAGRSLSRQEQLEAQEASAQAALRDAEDEQRAAEAALANPGPAAARLPVLAPADGYLVLRDEYSHELQIVSDLTRQVEGHIPQSLRDSVHIGQLATLTLDSEPNVTLHAVVQKIGDVQNSAVGQFYPVTLSLTDPAHLGNDSARVTITLQ